MTSYHWNPALAYQWPYCAGINDSGIIAVRPVVNVPTEPLDAPKVPGLPFQKDDGPTVT